MKVETKRLTITELVPVMAHDLHVLSMDEDMRRFLPDEVFETETIAEEVIRELAAGYGHEDERAPQVYAVTQKDGTLVGYVQAAPEGDGWEIGYHIGKPFTGRGYAAEAVRAFLPEIMPRLGVRELSGVCAAENIASRRVLEGCGFTLEYEGLGGYQGEERAICRYGYRKGE